jgi:hypothetical protein
MLRSRRGTDSTGVEPYITTSQDSHHPSWQERFAQEPEPPTQEVGLIVKMAYKLTADIGKDLRLAQIDGRRIRCADGSGVSISGHFITPDLNSGTLLQGEHVRAPLLAQPRTQFPHSEWTG